MIATETYVPDVNGAAYFVQRLARLLVSRGHEVHVVCPRAARQRPVELDVAIVHELPSRGVPRYPQLRVARPLLARPSMRRVLSAIEPDVVHVQNHFTVGRAAQAEARRRAVPVIGTNHFLPANLLVYLPVPVSMEPAIERLLWWQLRRVYGELDLLTAPTTYAAARSARACKRKFEVISCGVDVTEFRPDVSPDGFRARYDIPAGPTVLAVGRLDPEKHLPELIEALALLRDRVEAHLVIVGRGQQRTRLERMTRRLGLSEHVTFCGMVPDDLMPNAYAVGDVYCHAGRAELQSISTLEAMASGRPVVAADAGALPLLVRDGVNGYLFRPGDVSGLAARLEGVLADDALRRQMGATSRATVLEHGAERSASDFEAIYERAMSAATRARPSRHSPPRLRPSLSGVAVGIATVVLALPVLGAFVWPEPSSEATSMFISYLLASLSAAFSLRLVANVGLASMPSVPRWLSAGTAQQWFLLALSAGSALAVALGALAEHGALG